MAMWKWMRLDEEVSGLVVLESRGDPNLLMPARPGLIASCGGRDEGHRTTQATTYEVKFAADPPQMQRQVFLLKLWLCLVCA